MKLGVLTAMYSEQPLERVAERLAAIGFEAVELAAWWGSDHLDLDRAERDAAYRSSVRSILDGHGLSISALANHPDSKLLLGPHDETTHDWAPSKDAADKIEFAIERTKQAARVAALMEVPVVTGFTGSHVWDKWYTFPTDNERAYEEAWEQFAERWNPILDVYEAEGVRFALEVHPGEIAYNVETAARALAAVDQRPGLGFNFDPSHLVWQLIDPTVFIHEFPDRIYHVHAKDGELQPQHVKRSGVIPNGSWTRHDRGFRFRVPGWGDVQWKRVITALLEVGYDYVLSFEHEDPVMSREDACQQCFRYLDDIRIHEPLKEWGIWWQTSETTNEGTPA